MAQVRSGKAHRKAEFAQHGEGLGARHFVDQVQADQELGLAALKFADPVGIPDLFEECPGLGHRTDLSSGWSCWARRVDRAEPIVLR